MFVPVATGKKVRLSIEVEGDIPSEVHTAQEAVHRVLVNLVGNAVKFTSLGEVKIRLQANPLESGRWHIEIAVVDTGIGIEPRVLPKLIRPFVQADPSTTRQFGGTGLGLSIASQLASNIGGRLAVQSTPGVGSTFSFTFEADSRPVRSAADRDREPPDRSLVHQSAPCDIDVLRIDTGVAPPGSGSSFEPTLDGLRVLLVEDCPDNQRFIGLILRKAEAKVTVVENGRQACEQFRVNAAGDQEPYDVVLMDIQMPVMSGLEATSLLRNKGYKVPIIALTANAMESSRDSCLEAGCDDWATKPISKLDLLMLVSRNVAETQKRFDRG
jgi:CheY-like chemotaxis protein